MSANVGVALSLITQPATYADRNLSTRVRDAVHRSVLTPEALSTKESGGDADQRDAAGPAVQLIALLADARSEFSPAEHAMLREWLARLIDAPAT